MSGWKKRKSDSALVKKIFTSLGGLVAAGVAFGYSLYESREESLVPNVQVNIPVNAGRWQVTLISAKKTSLRPDGTRIGPGMQAILLEMVLQNRSGESSNIYGDLLKLRNLKNASRPQFYLDRDRESLGDLQPMMPERVTAMWEAPEAIPLPKKLEVAVEGDVFKRRDNLYAAPGWFPSGAVAHLELALSVGQKSGETP